MEENVPVSVAAARKLALSLPGVTEHDHFGLPAFRARIIFATLWPKDKRMMVKLTRPLQAHWCREGNGVFFPVPNKWGEGGATFVDLAQVDRSSLQTALLQAWREAAPPPKPAKKPAKPQRGDRGRSA